MKRRKIFIGITAVLTTVCMIALTDTAAHADIRDTKSRGNFVLDSGQMSIYAADVDYLQSEVKALYNELPTMIGINASGTGTARRDDLRSKGAVNYKNGTVILDASDFMLLADEIDGLESEYKANTVAALNDIGTYFKIDGSVTHDQREETLFAGYASSLSLDEICSGILQSQSVGHLTAAPIIADNLTAGTAAWVNGACIIGNGADNERAYKKGVKDGEEDDGEDIDKKYAYHKHVNGAGEEVSDETFYSISNPGGCYAADGHTHNKGGAVCTSTENKRTVTHNHEFHGTRGDATTCPHCGKMINDFPEGGGYVTHECSYHVTDTVWTCNPKGTNKWKIGCGKDAGQIESVIITIRPKR